jgi:hypothetical protein
MVTLEASALGLVSVILQRGPGKHQLGELYQDVAKHFESVDQFLLTLDLLYVLGRINVDITSKTLIYAD